MGMLQPKPYKVKQKDGSWKEVIQEPVDYGVKKYYEKKALKLPINKGN